MKIYYYLKQSANNRSNNYHLQPVADVYEHLFSQNNSKFFLSTHIIVLIYCEVGILMNPILQMMKLKNRNIKDLAQDYTANKCWSHDCSPVTLYAIFLKVTQSRPTLCDPMDYTVNRILQARILEWAAYPLSSGSSRPRNRTRVSCTAGGFFTS